MSFHLWNHLLVTWPTWNHLWNSKYFWLVLTYENIEYKIHTFWFTFKFILIKLCCKGFPLTDNYTSFRFSDKGTSPWLRKGHLQFCRWLFALFYSSADKPNSVIKDSFYREWNALLIPYTQHWVPFISLKATLRQSWKRWKKCKNPSSVFGSSGR